jgi:hypothetical protein
MYALLHLPCKAILVNLENGLLGQIPWRVPMTDEMPEPHFSLVECRYICVCACVSLGYKSEDFPLKFKVESTTSSRRFVILRYFSTWSSLPVSSTVWYLPLLSWLLLHNGLLGQHETQFKIAATRAGPSSPGPPPERALIILLVNLLSPKSSYPQMPYRVPSIGSLYRSGLIDILHYQTPTISSSKQVSILMLYWTATGQNLIYIRPLLNRSRKIRSLLSILLLQPVIPYLLRLLLCLTLLARSCLTI